MKLSKKELKEAKLMLSYYNSLDLDVGSGEGNPEETFRNALSKLINFYEQNKGLIDNAYK